MFWVVVVVVVVLITAAVLAAVYVPPALEQHRLMLNEESAAVNVADAARPSVVSVFEDASSRPASTSTSMTEFFQGKGLRNKKTSWKPSSSGSGFLAHKDGRIITNKHVVSNKASRYYVVTDGGSHLEVVDIYRDPSTDLAVLRINGTLGKNVKPLKLGSTKRVRPGQRVVAMGNALGELAHTVTSGVVSGVNRDIVSEDGGIVNGALQTDAAIYPGLSGGPLLDSIGQVIGVNVAAAESDESIAFAVPVEAVHRLLKKNK